MTTQYTARAPFYTYFYWAIFLFAGLFMALMLHRMIALASAEDESFSMTSVSSYRAQAQLVHEKRLSETPLPIEDFSDL